MIKNILFPTDFSEAANAAFIYALHVADHAKAAITTLHVYPPAEVKLSGLPRTLREFYESYDLEHFENYQDSIPSVTKVAEEHNFSHLEIRHVLKTGDVKKSILEIVRDNKADMIVMGTTGAKGLREIFLGSMAGEMLENANCPVLAVPQSAEFDGRLDRIAFTTSFKEEEKKALEYILDLAALFDAEVLCFNVDLPHTNEITHRMEKLRAEFKDHPRLSFEVVDGTDLMGEIAGFLRKHRIDILGMVTHKRSFIQELFNYSHAKKLSYHSNTPVLSIPAGLLQG